MRDNITVTDSVLRHFRNVVLGTAAANLLAWAVGAPWTVFGPVVALIVGLLWGFLFWTGIMVVAGKITINNVHKHAELTLVEPGAHRIDVDEAKVWINGRRVGYHSIHPRSQVGRKEIQDGADTQQYTLCVYELHEDSFVRRNYGVTTIIKYV